MSDFKENIIANAYQVYVTRYADRHEFMAYVENDCKLLLTVPNEGESTGDATHNYNEVSDLVDDRIYMDSTVDRVRAWRLLNIGGEKVLKSVPIIHASPKVDIQKDKGWSMFIDKRRSPLPVYKSPKT